MISFNIVLSDHLIRSNWEIIWCHNNQQDKHEEESFAEELNTLIYEISTTPRPIRYHDQEDILASYVIEKLKWPIYKQNGRWVGADYRSILEQGGFDDLNQAELLLAVTGRVHTAIKYGQHHYDDMEQGHREMVAAILAIILYNRSN